MAATTLPSSHKRRLSSGGAPPLHLGEAQSRPDPELAFAAQLTAAQYTIDLKPLLDAAVRVRTSSHDHPDRSLQYQKWWLDKASQLLGDVRGRVYFTLSRAGSRRIAGSPREQYIEQSGVVISGFRDYSSYAFLNILDDQHERHEFFFRDYQNPPAIVHQVYDRQGSLKQESYAGWELVPPVLHTVSAAQFNALIALNVALNRRRPSFDPFFRRFFVGQVGRLITGATINPFEMTSTNREAKRLRAREEEEEKE